MQILAAKEISDDRVEFKVKMESDNPPGAPQAAPQYVIQPMARIGTEWKLGGSTHSWNDNWEKGDNVTIYAK